MYLQLVLSGFTFGSLYRCWQIWQARMFLSICLMTCESHDWLPVPESSSSCCCWWWWWRDVDDERGEEAVPWPELHPAYRDEMVPEPGDRRRGFCCNKISDSFEEEIGFWKLFQFFLFSFFKWAEPDLYFVYFRSFFSTQWHYGTEFDYKKHRWFAWDSNPGRQDGRRRRIHWAMAASPFCFVYTSKFRDIVMGVTVLTLTSDDHWRNKWK